MYKKTITYTDYNGKTREEDFYFNLNKIELLESMLEIGEDPDTIDEVLRKMAKTHDHKGMFKLVTKLVLKAYGEKDADGIHFRKSETLSTDFSQTEAYVELCMELSQNDEKALEFIQGVIPSELAVGFEKEFNESK